MRKLSACDTYQETVGPVVAVQLVLSPSPVAGPLCHNALHRKPHNPVVRRLSQGEPDRQKVRRSPEDRLKAQRCLEEIGYTREWKLNELHRRLCKGLYVLCSLGGLR